jgi:putative CocE/NonD family hydrolase
MKKYFPVLLVLFIFLPDYIRPQNAVDYIFKKDVMIPMSDGVKLAANITLPAEEGRWPVVLIRTPYNKDADEDDDVGYWAEKDYAFVIQDCRGTNKSEGEWNPGANEIKDGFDTHEWVKNQPWCDGNIVTTGGSYVGATQMSVVPYADDSYKAAFAVVPLVDWYKTSYIGGALSLGTTFSWGTEMNEPTKGEGYGIDWDNWDWDIAFRKLPLINWDENIGRELKFMRDWVRHPTYDEHWERGKITDDLNKIDVPVMIISGWYDIFINQAVKYINKTDDLNIDNQHVIIGPWGHGPNGEYGELRYKNHSDIDMQDLEQRWFDHWAKGIDNDVENTPHIQIYVMGKNYWRAENEFPLERTVYTKYYLHSRGAANTMNGDGTLSVNSPGDEPFDSFTYDPENPVPTRGGAILFDDAGAFDQTDIEKRKDVLVYSTDVLTNDVEVTGPVNVTLYASTDARDTDFTAKLVDVHPDGKAYNLTDGIIRARYHESRMAEKLIEPGKIYKYEIDLWATSNVFLKGHKIRVEVSSSNFPKFDRNPNTGNKFGMDTEMLSAEQKIFHSSEYPSHILLPVIPIENK